MDKQKFFHRGSVASMALLIVWLVAWETVVAPIKPGGSLLALKAVPLLLPLIGAIKRDIYTLQWSSMVILLYFAEGVVRGYSDTDPQSQLMAWGEAAIVVVYFVCTILFLRPYKKAAKKMAAELLERMNSAK